MKIEERIFHKHYTGLRRYILFEDFPKDLFPTDKINIEKVEEQYHSDSSNDAFTTLSVFREREQTPEEIKKSEEKLHKRLEQSKKFRHEEFLKLKKEFEP